MKISCSVMKDILPLYLEDMASEDTRRLVAEHAEGCETCRTLLDEMMKEEAAEKEDLQL